MRSISFAQAICEATEVTMRRDPNVFIMGLGVPDPKGTFGTTLGLHEKFGKDRVFDIPTSENGMTGIAIGAALTGRRVIMTHQRVDFALLTLEQIFNQAAKWHYMFGGQGSVPLVIRMIIGRGWGQGPQHSQSLQATFAHIPGLKVVMPATPADAKGLLISSIEDNNPVMFLEHRWLHYLTDDVPEGYYKTPIGVARKAREGRDVTIVSTSWMTVEALQAQEVLAKHGISAEVLDLRTIRPVDYPSIFESVRKTGRLVVADTGTKAFGVSAEICAAVTESEFSSLKAAPVRVALPDYPTPTSHALAKHYYPGVAQIVNACAATLGKPAILPDEPQEDSTKLDVPNNLFKGPF
jgi:pyruvate/2-oxoglutarate/acetoin dehydrogenase E1 component